MLAIVVVDRVVVRRLKFRGTLFQCGACSLLVLWCRSILLDPMYCRVLKLPLESILKLVLCTLGRQDGNKNNLGGKGNFRCWNCPQDQRPIDVTLVGPRPHPNMNVKIMVIMRVQFVKTHYELG